MRIEHLFLVTATTGVLVLFDVAYRSEVPDLVGHDGVLEANSRLATVDAVAEITTPGLPGVLVQVIAAPLAILLDVVSFVRSAVCVLQFRQPERPRQSTSAAKCHAWSEITEGLRAVGGSPDATRTGGMGGSKELPLGRDTLRDRAQSE